MSTAAAVKDKPAPTDGKPPKLLSHIFCKCTKGNDPRISYCGLAKAVGNGRPYDPRLADPDMCAVCLDLRENQGCKLCGSKQ